MPQEHNKHHYSLEAEQSVLGALIIDNESMEIIYEILVVDDFYHDAHKIIYNSIIYLYKENTAVDIIILAEFMENIGDLEKIGGLQYLASLADGVPSATNAKHYAKIVLEKSSIRNINVLSAGMVEASKSLRSKEILSLVQKEITNLSERIDALDSGFRDFKELLNENINDLQHLYQRENINDIPGLSTGLNQLDEFTLGLQNEEIITIAGRPGMGKTMLAMNIVESVAIKSKKNIAVFSMEMNDKSLSLRVLGSVAKIDSSSMRMARFSDHDWAKLSNALGKLHDAKIYVDDSPSLNINQIHSRISRLKSKIGEIGLIVIDYIQLVSSEKTSKENRATELAEIMKGIKILARKIKCPVIILSQLNRNVEMRANKRPNMSDLSESGSIERDSNLVIFIYRDEVYNSDSDDKGIAELIIAKQRNGKTGTVRTRFNGEYMRFENLYEG